MISVVNAVMANGAEVPISTVEDVPVTSSLPGNAHYSSFRSEPPSLRTGRMERKHVPEAGKYRIPRRCPQVPKELKLFAGAIELEDDEVILSRCVNTGGPPVTEVRRIGSYKLIDQAVIRAEHVLTKAELLMQDREMDSCAPSPPHLRESAAAHDRSATRAGRALLRSDTCRGNMLNSS